MADQTKRTMRKTTDGMSARPGTARGTVTKSRTRVMPTHEQIRVRAYEVYLRRNNGPGSPESDWTEAERELLEELNA